MRNPIQQALVPVGNAQTYDHSFGRDPNVGSQGPRSNVVFPRLTYGIQSQDHRSLLKPIHNVRSFCEDLVPHRIQDRELQGPRPMHRLQQPIHQPDQAKHHLREIS